MQVLVQNEGLGHKVVIQNYFLRLKKNAMFILKRAAHTATANISVLLSKGIYFKPEMISCTAQKNHVSEGDQLCS